MIGEHPKYPDIYRLAIQSVLFCVFICLTGKIDHTMVFIKVYLQQKYSVPWKDRVSHLFLTMNTIVGHGEG